LIGVGQFQDAIDHAGSAGEAKQAPPSVFKTEKQLTIFSEAADIELGNFRRQQPTWCDCR